MDEAKKKEILELVLKSDEFNAAVLEIMDNEFKKAWEDQFPSEGQG